MLTPSELKDAERQCRAHVLLENGGGAVLCTRCGDRQPLPLPMRADTWSAFVGAYGKLHAACTPKE